MAGIFWDSEGLLLVEFLEVDTTINSKQYRQTLKKVKTINVKGLAEVDELSPPLA